MSSISGLGSALTSLLAGTANAGTTPAQQAAIIARPSKPTDRFWRLPIFPTCLSDERQSKARRFRLWDCAMNAQSNRYTAVHFLDLCRAAIRASEESSDPAMARRHARRAIRLAKLGERQARLEAGFATRRQRTGFSSN